MVLFRVGQLIRPILTGKTEKQLLILLRNSTEYSYGAIKPKPDETPYGLVHIVCAVVPGLFMGAAISKNVATFLEENELFVPEDDDDDD